MDIPGYQIEGELGRGGMATVYLAVQKSVDRRVALKVMSPVLMVDRTFTDRFIREARIAASLYHPHVVAVHDVGIVNEQPFIAMEYLPGDDLAAKITARKIDLPTALRIAREIASALAYAHQKGFVHRDIKPENILFRTDGTSVLTDFGIARAVNSVTQMTKTGAVIGTPQYMSPEQARGRDIDGRSDLYGLGIVIYEMLTGTVPFEGADSISVGIKHVTEQIPKLPARFSHVQPIIDRFVAKHPDDRYQTGLDACEDLEALEAKLMSGPATPKPRDPAPPAIELAATAPAPARDIPPPKQQRRPASPPTPSTSTPESTPSPKPASPRAAVGATPRPDGSVRQEPTLGSLDDFSSFERTVTQPSFADLEIPASQTDSRRGGRWKGMLWILLVGALGFAGWWQRDALLAMLPNQDVAKLLERAQTAMEYGHWYGDSPEYANQLYELVLEMEPDNESAQAGMDLVASHLLDESEKASRDGNESQARLYFSQAREVAPAHDRVAQLTPRFGIDTTPARIEKLLGEAEAFATQDHWTRPPLNNAVTRYQTVLSLDDDNERAQQGLARAKATLEQRFLESLDGGDLALARERVADLMLVMDEAELEPLKARLAAAETVERDLQRQQELADAEARAEAQAAAEAASARQRQLDSLLAQANTALSSGRLTTGNGNAVQLFREVLALDSDNRVARDGLSRVAQGLLQRAEIALEEDELSDAAQHIQQIESLNPGLPGLERARNRLALYRQQRERQISAADAQRVARLISEANEAMARNDLMQPPGGSAYDLLKSALRVAPNSPEVAAGLNALAARLAELASEALRTGDSRTALLRHNQAQQADARLSTLTALGSQIAAALRETARTAISSGELDEAEQALQDASDLDPRHPDVESLQLQLNIARDSG